jgi:hypothetical protein
MIITNIDTFVEEFRNGRDIWSRTAIELAVREIERLKQRVAVQEDLLRLAEGDKQTISEVLTNTIARRDKRIAELEQERRWIPVSERLPEDSRIYDVAIAGYEYSWTGTCVFGKWIGESGKAILGVTHWKYRPQPPKEKTK